MHYDQPVRAFMTEAVHTISLETSLPDARKAMENYGVRHLPVLDGNNIVGLLSERDLGKLEGFPMVDLAVVSVPDAMSEVPYIVTPDTPVVEVVRTMREKRYGSAVVAESGKVVGMFTTTDALAMLISIMSRQARD